MSGAREASPMEGVTGTVAWLSQVPGCSRAGLYGPANIDFPMSLQLRLQRAARTPSSSHLRGQVT